MAVRFRSRRRSHDGRPCSYQRTTCSSHAVSRRPATPCSPTGVPPARRLIRCQSHAAVQRARDPSGDRAERTLGGAGTTPDHRARRRLAWTTIDLELPDGATAAAQAPGRMVPHRGRSASRRARLTEARLEWRTTSGDVSSSRIDVLDDDTFAEECARRPGCVEDAVARLHDAALAARARRTSDDPLRSER